MVSKKQALSRKTKLALLLLVVSCLAYVISYYAFNPQLSIGKPTDNATLNMESTLTVSNTGNATAYNVVYDYTSLSFRSNAFNMGMNYNSRAERSLYDNGEVINKLTPGEPMEIPLVPNFKMPVGKQLIFCTYNLRVEYQTKVLFFKKNMKKLWQVEFRNSNKEYKLDIKPLK